MEKEPPGKGIVAGQHVASVKQQRARELRANMTAAERLLWQQLRANHLDGIRWRRQQVIDGFIADFYCHKAGLIVELDGAVHDAQTEYDSARDETLAAHNLFILRIPNEEVYRDIDGVLARIKRICQERTERE